MARPARKERTAIATDRTTRRAWLRRTLGLGAGAALSRITPAFAWTDATAEAPSDDVDLTIAPFPLLVNGRTGSAIAVNGTVPGPLVRLREGRTAVIRVTNRLKEIASIHWHGVLVPEKMDGVPGVSFGGITPGETFTYRFPVRQSGTYWAHSHSGGQELLGVYFPLIIDPLEREPFTCDRDYVVVLSDWSFESPMGIIAKLKKQSDYYNFQKRTAADFVRDARTKGLGAAFSDRASWSRMRMDPTDLADVTGYTYTYLVNGLSPAANWTGLFTPGESIRLRFIGAGAMTFFDVRIPGLTMRMIQADGQNIEPIDVEEFRLAPGETYDAIIRPDDRAYTLFAEALDRSGYARGTIAPRPGMTAAVPARRTRPLRTMADMGMVMTGMDHTRTGGSAMPGMNMPGTDMPGMKMPVNPPVMHGPDTHGPGNSSIAHMSRSRLGEPGAGLENTGRRVLVYADLKSATMRADRRKPARDVELHITGNMDRYMWSFDGKKYSEAATPIPFAYGERLRLVFVNDTMMEHPIHLHGMYMELENGAGAHQPLKHTISVKPAERLTLAITADAPGQWAMHCHLLLHMELGMFRVVEVSAPAGEVRA